MQWSNFRHSCRPSTLATAALALAIVGASVLHAQEASDDAQPEANAPRLVDFAQLSPSAQRQIAAIAAAKRLRTPAQRKISSSLLASAKVRSAAAGALRPVVPARADGRVDVEIFGSVNKALVAAVEKAGGEVLFGREQASTLRALVPLGAVESLAGRADVRRIRPTIPAMAGGGRAAGGVLDRHIGLGSGRSLAVRAERVRSQLQAAIERLRSGSGAAPAPLVATAAVTSSGDTAHRADEARRFYGLTGAGVNIGVLSDSVDGLDDSIAIGELPADVTVLPGQSGVPGSGEGTAMLEIVHDLAPGAKLFFATAFTSSTSFADNIRALRSAGCNIIVDDVIYFAESPFQDGEIAKAVQDVTADGALYFSSAGNEGNFNDGTSGTWEGDFKLAKSTIPILDGLGGVHDFGQGVVSNFIELSGGPMVLYWSDPAGGAADDYDLYVLDNNLSEVVVASTDTQDGDDDPIEFLGFFIPAGFRAVIVKFGGEDRAVNLILFGGEFGLATSGATHGHAAVAAAFGVAAVDAATAGGGAFTGGATNPIEIFSSDGYRRVFFDADGTAFKPGKFLFKGNGGQVRKKPDVAAADGVDTSVPGFAPFFGTSAAAPHAAAIAGLLKSAKPDITTNRVRTALTRSALDNEALGRDRDSGFGIVDAFGALADIRAKAAPFLELGDVTATPTSGDGDAFVEPGESASLTTELVNSGGAAPKNLKGVLSTLTPGVTITSTNSTWPEIPPGGGTSVGDTPFAFTLSPSAPCGLAPEFTLTATYSNGALSPQVFSFKVPTGQPGTTPTTSSYSGPPVPIPDATPTGVAVPVTVAGAVGNLSTLQFRIDGDACSATIGSTTVGLDHTWVGDLVISLTSPQGTTVILASRPGGALNSGNNFCQTVFDDTAADSIQGITPSGNPYTGSFAPANPLSDFIGEDPNGTWTLTVSDLALFDTGSVRAFSLIMTTFSCGS